MICCYLCFKIDFDWWIIGLSKLTNCGGCLQELMVVCGEWALCTLNALVGISELLTILGILLGLPLGWVLIAV